MRILYVSGSSAGHLAPLVAVEQAVRQKIPTAESVFVCSETKEDTVFLEKEHVQYQTLPLPRHPLRHPFQLLRSIQRAKSIIHTFKPDIIFSKGGIVSVPLCWAAHQQGIPIVLHESDAVMGKANRVIARWAIKICVGFPEKDTSHEHQSKHIVTGNPVRQEIGSGSRNEGLRITNLSGTRPILLVAGGSQGAQALNDAIVKNCDRLLAHVDIIHLTGRGKRTSIHAEGYWQTEFVHEELPHLYAAADIALSRAGAGTISELAAHAIATILVPIEGLANNHQFLNAIMAQENGACIILLQKKLMENLPSVIIDLLKNTEQRNQISQKLHSLYHPDAARHIAENILECVA